MQHYDETDIRQVEVSIEHAKKAVDMRDALVRLSKNRDFKKVILEGYLEKEAARLALISAHSHPTHVENRDEIILQIQGISCFNQFLQTIEMIGNVMANEIAQNEELLDELRAVEASGEEGEE